MWTFLIVSGLVGLYYLAKAVPEIKPASQFEILPDMWNNPSFKSKITPEWEAKVRPNDKDINNVEPPRHIVAFMHKVGSTDSPFLSILEVVKSSPEKSGISRSFDASYIVSGAYNLNDPMTNADDYVTNKYFDDQPTPGTIFHIPARDIYALMWGDAPGGFPRG